MANPVVYFEIPVANLSRAINFYNAVFDSSLVAGTYGGIEMAIFPGDAADPGVLGALVLDPPNSPSTDGTIVYFDCASISGTIEKVETAKGRILVPSTPMPTGVGYKAEFEDSEGNRVALYSLSE